MWDWLKNIASRGLKSKLEKDTDDIFQREGKVENMAYAIERVINKERLVAKKEGKLEEKNGVVKEMLREGEPLEKISRVTKLSINKIEEIAREFIN